MSLWSESTLASETNPSGPIVQRVEPPSKYLEWGITDEHRASPGHVSEAFSWINRKGKDLLPSTHPLSDSKHTTGISVGSEVSLAACWARTDITPACSSHRVPQQPRLSPCESVHRIPKMDGFFIVSSKCCSKVASIPPHVTSFFATGVRCSLVPTPVFSPSKSWTWLSTHSRSS